MLTATSPEVVEFVAAYQENRNLAIRPGPSGERIVVIERRKYLAIDEQHTFEGADAGGRSGRFLVDRADGTVYTIRGYGQRGWRVGTLEKMAADYRAGSATFNADADCHWETRHGKVATWPTPRQRPQLTLLQGGRA